MTRAYVLLMVLAGIAAGLSIGVNLPIASAAPSLPAFMVEVNGVQVHRFVDSTADFATVCYVARGSWGGYTSPAISCVRAKP